MASIQRLYVREPEITEVYGEPVRRKRRAVATMEGQAAEIRVTIVDDQGNTVALIPDDSGVVGSSAAAGGGSSAATANWVVATPNLYDISVKVRFREATLIESTIYEGSGVVWDADAGEVSAIIDPDMLAEAGIYLTEFGVFDSDDDLIYSNEIFLYNRKSAWGTNNTKQGPPSIDDIRLSLRDNDPVDNLLLDYYDFDLAEICHAAVRTVQFWNDQTPQLAIATFTTKTFPFRDIWLEGIQLFLFMIAEEHYRRNRLAHAAGGTQIDDKNKLQEYRAAWQDRMGMFKQRIIEQKAAINATQCYSGLGAWFGGYGHGYGRWY